MYSYLQHLAVKCQSLSNESQSQSVSVQSNDYCVNHENLEFLAKIILKHLDMWLKLNNM